MKPTRLVITAFSICIALSLLIGILLLLNVKAIPQHTRMIDTGKQIVESALAMQSQEKDYVLSSHKDVLDHVKDTVSNSRKLLSLYEKSTFTEKRAGLVALADWDEAMNLYERLFDQFVLYHDAVEKNIAAIRELEKSILAVIYSKMNPERGIIGLQEIRIHEKGYLLYRNYPKPVEERPFQDMRKEAVSNFLMWAHKDKRIEELMEKDNQLFNDIISNYERQDSALLALGTERRKIENIGETFLEEGQRQLHISHHRCMFLSITLLVMWAITGIAVAATMFRR
jgi:hypothetical protein